ncbi:hypothetical protein FB473_002106 [Brooklawnia cerclae]|uniref:Uncharacterized protein n=1 Tax=Brooklawnia cerclae TaxID=349934 RepID=A0ABX0SL71_9ACTN|nr:hypothetical protein [Brooklawnia cerclae]
MQKRGRNVWPGLAFFHSALVISLYILYRLITVGIGSDDYIYNPSDPVWQHIARLNRITLRIFFIAASLLPVGSAVLFFVPKWKLFAALVVIEVGLGIAAAYFTHQALQALPA